MISETLALVVLSAAANLNLQALLDQVRTEQDVPGVSAVVTHQGDVVFSGASGTSDLESGDAMTADTVLYAGSLTKILTATLALRLIDEGNLSLDEVVAGIATGSATAATNITVAHLLTHASGLEREGNFGYWFSADFPDDAALALYLTNTELRSVPGTTVHYSNVGFAALGAVLANASELSYHDALQTRVFEPLGMTASGSPGPVTGIAPGYTPTGRVIPNEARPFAGVGREIGGRHLREYHNAKAMTPAFGAFTTANDLSRIARFLLGYGASGFLPDALRLRMLQPETSRRTLGLGAGRYEGHSIARHGGWFAAHKSHILIDLDAEIGVVVLANSDNADPDAIAKALLSEVLNSAP